jgi:hypothetical protein
MMAKVVFVGESSARDVVVPNGSVRAVRGEPVEVPDDVAKSLLEQDVWESAAAVTKESK